MSHGDADYGVIADGYPRFRRTEPAIAALVHEALGDAMTVVNVGAGPGSYEPVDCRVVAVEPSPEMRAQRPAGGGPVVSAVAQALPLADVAVDAAMAMVTVHQWPDLERGIAEMRRVSRGPVVILTFDPDALDRLWLAEYIPEYVVHERQRMPTIDRLDRLLGGGSRVTIVPVPFGCVDGFTEAYYGRPEAFLDVRVRAAQSLWTFVDPGAQRRGLEHLRADLDSGRWDEYHGHLRAEPFFEGSLRLVVSR